MEGSKEQQLFFMRWAIQLGERGRCTAPPNPWVGCVIVKDGALLGEGYHEAPGKKHAEIVAIEQAGILAKGATAYISLEPCSHHGRTPPCVDSLIQAGIRKAVIPFLDPDPHVSGRGVEKLKKAGIEVVIGIGKEEAARSLEPYLHQRTLHRPYCIVKSALSLDGRTAAADGSSKWITGEKARSDVQLLRAASQAIIIGAQTALLDQPRLTVRMNVDRQPLRVLLDSQGRVPVQGPLTDISLAPTLVYTCDQERQREWVNTGAEAYCVQKISLKDVLSELSKREVIQALIEGGSRLHTSFLKEKLVNKVIIYLGNCVLGEKGNPFLSGFDIENIGDALRWKLEGVHRFDDDVRLDFSL